MEVNNPDTSMWVVAFLPINFSSPWPIILL